MIKWPRNLYVLPVESWGIQEPIGNAQPKIPNVTIVKNWDIGRQFATHLLSQELQAAAQLPDQKGLTLKELIKPIGPFVWAPVFQAVEMRRLLQ